MSAGYNYHQSTLHLTNFYNYKRLIVSGEVLSIGLQRKFSPLYSHTFGLGFVNRSSSVDIESLDSDNPSEEQKYTRYQYHEGATQLYYSAKLSTFKIKSLALNFGVALERTMFNIEKIDKIQESNFNKRIYLGSPIFHLGLSYDWKIDDNLFLTSKFLLAKSYYDFFNSSFDPISGNTRGGIDYNLSIGMRYKLSENIKTPLKMWKHVLQDKEKKLSIQTVEFRVLQRHGLWSLFYPEPYPYESPGCGYCEIERSVNQTGNTYKGYGFGLSYSLLRFQSSFEVAFEQYHSTIETTFIRHIYHPHLPYGKIKDYYMEKDYYSFSMDRLNLSLGFGFKLFSSQRKFNIIPSVRFSKGSIKNLEVKSNYFTKERYRNWNMTQDPNYNIDWDSTFMPSRIVSPAEKNNSFQYGVVVNVDVFKNFQLNADIFISRRSSAFMSSTRVAFSDKMLYNVSFGIGYKIPFKRWKGKEGEDLHNVFRK